MHYSATQAGIVLIPRTIAMMIASPFVGRLYNKVSPAILVGFGILLTSLGSWMMADVDLRTSSAQMIVPLAVTGAGFAFLFVPLTTAALSGIQRHELAGAAGVNSFVRQIGASIGISVFATIFTNYATTATSGLANNVTLLRPEIAVQYAAAKMSLMSRGLPGDIAGFLAAKGFYGRAALQGTVIGFEKTFVLQVITFLAVMPLLLFLRVKREPSAPKAHVELPVE
jgi:MFS transporter, DHA2 family, multidrug resistance protein